MQNYCICDLKLEMFCVRFIHKKHVFNNSPVADANANASVHLVGVPAEENLKCNESGVGWDVIGGTFVPEC